MRDFSEYFKGKKVTVMGLGLLGRGIGDALFLAEQGVELIVTDLKSADELKDSVAQFDGFTNVTFVLGEHREEDFKDRDMVLVAAGVPLDSVYLAVARKNNVTCVMSGALFAELSDIPIIGVTGTRGKSTVTHMIHHVLTQVTEGAPVLLGGNVRGVSNLQLLKEVEEDSLAVMELDSWQLQGFGWAGMSPQVAVFTNFMEDHLNYYKGSMEAYFADKAQIFMHQEESGVFITTPEVFERARAFAKGKNITLGQEVVLVDDSTLPDTAKLLLPGSHNRINAALAFEALKATGLEEEIILEGLASFSGLPGRLEYLGEKKGVKIYNDNNATTPTATRAGLKAVAEGKNVILIMGGAGKELDVIPLLETIPEYCKSVILLPGSGTDLIKEKVDGHMVASLTEAVNIAFEDAENGDVILFSPAFASFGMFKNEYDRNDQFVDVVRRL